MAWVFVSHAGEDFELACEVYGWLIDAGHEVFLDQHPRHGIAVGEEWEQRLHDELRRADAMVCVVTSAYVASEWCTGEITIARNRGITLLPVQAETGVAHPRLTSVQHANLTRNPDAVRTSLIEALRLIDATRPDNRFPARFARRFAQCTGIAMVVMIALNPLYTPHPPASTLAAPPNTTTPPNTTAPVIGSPVGTTPAPSEASTSRPAMHPGTPYPDQIYGLHFIPGPICPAPRATYPCYQSQWLDSSGKPRPGSLAASVTISPNGLLFTGTSYGNPEGFPGVYVRHFQGQAANDITQPVRFSGTWTDPDGNTGNFTLVPR